MLVSAFKKSEQAPLKVINTQLKTDASENLLHAITAKTEVADTVAHESQEPTLQIVDPKPLVDKFTITFSYGQQLHRTKVLKVGAGYRKPAYIYKVALNSRLSNHSSVCWLQPTSQGWSILLGDHLDASLIKAITSAIESME